MDSLKGIKSPFEMKYILVKKYCEEFHSANSTFRYLVKKKDTRGKLNSSSS